MKSMSNTMHANNITPTELKRDVRERYATRIVAHII
jgi:hypothetical protein